MSSKMVKVLQGGNGRACCIFRNDKKWINFPPEKVYTTTKAEAVRDLREQVFELSKNPLTGLSECRRCGRIITWESMEMHEVVFRGRGGEQSLENCEALCHQCHTGSPDSAHGNRRWQTAKLRSTKDNE